MNELITVATSSATAEVAARSAIAASTTAATTEATTTTAAATTETAATTTTTTAASESTATATGRAIFLRTRDVHCQRTAIDGSAVHARCSSIRFLRSAHGDKAEATGTASELVQHHDRFRHNTVRAEGRFEVFVCRREGEVPHEEFIVH